MSKLKKLENNSKFTDNQIKKFIKKLDIKI